MDRKSSQHFINIFLTVLVFSSLLLSPIASVVDAAELPQETEPKVEVETALSIQLNADQTSGYLIYFREQPDLSAANEMDWEARGRSVVSQLQKTAASTQAKVKAFLDAQGVKYKSYWIDNVIVVDQSDSATFRGLLNFSEIEILRARRHLMMLEPETISTNPNSVQTIETNISRIGTDQVWAMGFDGSGIVVANIDTGVRYTHEALVNQYRGNLGGDVFNHNYNWWDPALGDQNFVPDDWHGHGSHTMGTILGDDGGDNQIGMAPGAAWIACQAFEFDDNELLECGQFIAAPWDLNQQNPDPDLRPHIVNNSWGDCLQSYDPWYDGVIGTWHALGIYPVFSNGNASNCAYASPPGLNTVGNPARAGNVTAVGSTNRDDGTYAVHSNWGPTDNPDTINPRGFSDLKPQVVAPGYDIRSSTNGSDTQYENWAGTSMAAPHVSGLVALMWDAAPCLIGDYANTETILEETANPIFYDDGSPTTPTNHPNYATGWGEIDAYEAVQASVEFCGAFIITADPTEQSRCIVSDDDVAYELDIANLGGSASSVTLSTQGQPVGTGVAFSINPVTPPATSTLTISGLSAVSSGNYVIDVIGIAPTETHTTTIGLDLFSQQPSQVILTAPADEASNQPPRPVFGWDAVTQAESYLIEIATDNNFNDIVISQVVPINSYSPVTDLDTNSVFYWRVKAQNTCGEGAYSQVWSFSTAPSPGACSLGTNPRVLYNEDFENGSTGWSSAGISDTWIITSSRAYSGNYAYHAEDTPTISDQQLTSPSVVLPTGGHNSLTLQYWNWQDLEAGFVADECFDGGVLEITTDDGNTWIQLQDNVFQTTSYDGVLSDSWGNPLGGLNAWCGSSTGWINSVVNLDTYAGQTVKFRYRLGTDSSIGKEGWYLDDVKVQSCKSPVFIYLPLVTR